MFASVKYRVFIHLFITTKVAKFSRSPGLKINGVHSFWRLPGDLDVVAGSFHTPIYT